MQGILSDFRIAVRLLGRHRGFAIVAVFVLGIGIGANTAIFSAINAVILTPLPFEDPDRIVRLHQSLPERGLTYFSVAPSDFQDWKAGSRSFAAMGAFSPPISMAQTSTAEPAPVVTARAEVAVFQVLGVSPARGRLFTVNEERLGARVVVVAHEFWKTRLGNEPNVVGQQLELDGAAHEIVGVMPEGFFLPGSPAQVWTPLSYSQNELARGRKFLRVLARLNPGVSIEAARAELAGIAASLAQRYPGTNQNWTVAVRTLKNVVLGDTFEPALLVLGATVGFVLLIACANVANLLLVRGVARSREMAVRAALGASRRRIARQLLAESFVLAGVGGVAGLLLAIWGVDALRGIAPATLPRLDEIRTEGTVLAFTAALTITTGALFGLLPALQASRTDVNDALKDAHGSGAGRRRQRARSLLVVSEIALALVLLTGAGLSIRTFARILDVPLGFNPDGVATISLSLPEARYEGPPQVDRFYRAMMEGLTALPGVEAVGAISSIPMAGLNSGTGFRIPGRPAPRQAEVGPEADYRIVTPDYFRAMGISILRGRGFNDEDRAGAPVGIVASETMARQYWAGEEAVGQRVEYPGTNGWTAATIVGVAGDVLHFGPEARPRPLMYLAHAQHPARTMGIVVRGRNAAELMPAIRQVIWSIDPQQAIGVAQTMEEIVGSVTAQRRFSAVLLAIFAGAALLLAAVGVYGVMAFTVSLRTREIGLRMALGARGVDVHGLVLRQGLALAAPGVAIGTLLGLWLTRWMQDLLFQVEPTDPATFTVAALLLMAVALLACYLPARRAAKVDPAAALRAE